MPAKLPAAKISDLCPSADEVAAAKRTLESLSKAERRSREGSLANFLKNNPDSTVRGASGMDKEKYPVWFMCHQAKAKLNEKSFSSSREVTTNNSKTTAVYWWSLKKMNDEMGEKKAEASS